MKSEFTFKDQVKPYLPKWTKIVCLMSFLLLSIPRGNTAEGDSSSNRRIQDEEEKKFFSNQWLIDKGLKIVGSSGGKNDNNLEYMFGGPSKGILPKKNGTFSDKQGKKTDIHWVEWTMPAPMFLTSYLLTPEKAGLQRRKISKFKLHYYHIITGKLQEADSFSSLETLYDEYISFSVGQVFNIPIFAKKFRATFVQERKALFNAPKINKLEGFGWLVPILASDIDNK